MLEKFSTPQIRVLHAKLNNPSEFKTITAYLDGHNTRIDYHNLYEIYESKKHMFSFKLKKSGLKTQLVLNVMKFWIAVSDSVDCASNNDGSHLMTIYVDS